MNSNIPNNNESEEHKVNNLHQYQQQKLQNQEPDNDYTPKNKQRIILIVAAAVLTVLIGLGVWYILSLKAENEEARQQVTQVNAEKQQIQEQAEKEKSAYDWAQMENEYNELTKEFSLYENQQMMVMDDSVKQELTEKYEAARLQVEKLQNQLKNQQKLSAAEIQKLKDEISTLRSLLKHYVEEIDRLNKENDALRTENADVKDKNARLSSQVEETSRKNEVLTERMTLAEKLNVTGVNLTPLNKKGKEEKKVKNAKQLMITFSIPQNVSTPVGEKTIYARLLSPTGQLLGGSGSFSFEGSTLQCTAKKSIEYAGVEIGGIKIYWDVNTALEPGAYTVELFADNYRLISRSFNLK